MKTVRVITIGAVLGAVLITAAAGTLAAQLPQAVWETNAHGLYFRSIAYSKDGKLLGSGGDDAFLRVWNWQERSLVWAADAFNNQYDKVTSLAFSPDGTRVAGGGDEGATRLWDIVSGRRLWIIGSGDQTVYSVAFSPDGQTVALGKTRAYGVVDVTSGFGRYAVDLKCTSVALSPDGSLLAAAVHIPPEEYEPLAGYARIADVTNRNVLHTLTGHSNHVYSVDFSPDGLLLLTTSLDGTARLWNVSDGSVVRVIEGGGGVFGKFSADGKTFFTCAGVGTVDFLYDTGTLKFWRTSDGALLASFDNLGAGPIAVSPTGRYFAYGKADGFLVVAYVPLWIESITRANNEVTLRWQDGSGKYQVQAATNLTSAPWADSLGPPTTNTTFTHSARSHLFYRVQSLPNP